MTQTRNPIAARAVTDGGTILATAEIAALPERVFRALTTDEAETWWGSADTYRVRDWAADLKLGGRWALSVVMPDGVSRPASGVFLEIDAPRKIVQTRRYEWDFPLLGWRDTTVTYQLEATPAGTRMTVRHDGFAGTVRAAEQHVEGWQRFLGFLQAYLGNSSARKADR